MSFMKIKRRRHSGNFSSSQSPQSLPSSQNLGKSPKSQSKSQDGRKTPAAAFPFPFSAFGSRSALLISSILLGLQACLTYPARLNFGKPQWSTQELAQESVKAYDPAATLISSHLIMELSHPQLEALELRGSYADLLEALNLRGNYADLLRYPVQVYRISYRSRNFTPLSALILLPMGLDIRDYPILAYNHGTILPFPARGNGAYEAPSFFGSPYLKAKKAYGVTTYGLPAAASGYLTVLPDYMGYGIRSGEEHPFMIGPELGQEIMDALRATKQWAEQKGIELRKEVYLAGISEGAYGAMWAQRLAEAAPDFQDTQITGAYYAGPYHISSIFKKIAFSAGGIEPLFNWGIYSIWDYFLRDAQKSQQYLDQYFPPEQYSRIANNRQSWQKSDIWLHKVPNILTILLQKPTPKEKLFQPSFLEQVNQLSSGFWTLADRLNIHAAWHPKGPIYLYHNSQDPLIPLNNSEDAQAALTAAGGQVKLQIYQRSDHAGGYRNYLFDSLSEFSHRSGLYVPVRQLAE